MTHFERCIKFSLLLGAAALLAACASKPKTSSGARPGAYYKDDGPAASVPADIDRIPDAVARAEPLHRFANRPYNVFGVAYRPLTRLGPLRQRGIASWYGRKFHGQKTAIGETYDMFAMTAAHPTAPLPSFARITHMQSGRSVVVRVNDRGPFHSGRIVDLSYAAASRLGIAQGGSGEVEFELLLPPFQANPLPEPVVAFASPPPVPATPSDAPAIAISSTQPSSQDFYYVQLAAFGNFANAQAFQQRMSIELATTPRVQQVDALFRVRLGPFATRTEAEAARDRAQSVLSTPLVISSTLAR
ncbi:MAG: septal ring lytic transglycosylase RlpA family protein [Casimicrobium sp.]